MKQAMPRGPVRVPRDEALARMAAGDAAVARQLAQAQPPAACGPDIPAAPARGPAMVFAPYVQVGNARVHAGHRAPGEDRPRSALVRATALDLIERAAARRRSRDDAGADADAGADGGADARAPVFTAAQLGAAARYRALVESHAAGGLRCASVESRVDGGGGAGGGFADAFLAEGQAIARLQAAIGPGSALAMRRIRPSARGSRRSIPDRVLVDMIVLGDASPRAVLRRHGWAVKAALIAAAVAALAAALDRMSRVR